MIYQTGQANCYDRNGHQIDCQGTGQDGEWRSGTPWPDPRFEARDRIVIDHLTGLTWSRNANPGDFPMTWVEALGYVQQLRRDKYLGYDDWRLPNRRELRSMIGHQTRKPALPENHPFENIFLGWYWTSTTAAIYPANAWYIHLEGARMFYGGKDQSFLTWPVRGTCNNSLLATGQKQCYDAKGSIRSCAHSGQDGEYQLGRQWDENRFTASSGKVLDNMTGLLWTQAANISGEPVSWQQALDRAHAFNIESDDAHRWRLPNINELESLVDCSSSRPALPDNHPFKDLQDGYWSSTTSFFEPDWAWALYLEKGAIGVGQKPGKHFYVWLVANPWV